LQLEDSVNELISVITNTTKYLKHEGSEAHSLPLAGLLVLGFLRLFSYRSSGQSAIVPLVKGLGDGTRQGSINSNFRVSSWEVDQEVGSLSIGVVLVGVGKKGCGVGGAANATVMAVFLQFSHNVLVHGISWTSLELFIEKKVVESERMVRKQFSTEASLWDLSNVNEGQGKP
jgi:hypothetical protein